MGDLQMMEFTTHGMMALLLSSLLWMLPPVADCASIAFVNQACCCAPEGEPVESSCCASEAPAPLPENPPCGCHVQGADGALPETFQLLIPASSSLIKIMDVEASAPLMILDDVLAERRVMALSTAGPPHVQQLIPSMSCVFRL